jgi:hypothetical protein
LSEVEKSRGSPHFHAQQGILSMLSPLLRLERNGDYAAWPLAATLKPMCHLSDSAHPW